MEEFPIPYFPNTEADRQEMLKVIGVSSADDLFQDIPAPYRDVSLDLPPALSELELRLEMEELARNNYTPGEYACFLGGGASRHYVPAVVRQIISRGEFMTSYTPYQPEVSQGTLQATYEFQTMICQLTGMDIANAGMYEGASAFAEAALMACRVTGRENILVLDTVTPSYRQVLETYAIPQGLKVQITTSSRVYVEEGTACLMVQNPNHLGYLEDLGGLAEKAHQQETLLVVSVDPTSLAFFRPPGDFSADIVVGETQPLGIPLSFGGPYVGLFACREEYLRQMPGRIVGKTVDTQGRTGYVLTLQAREQHIRRARATSNICTSEALIALASTSYVSALGKRGLRHVAELCYHKAHYAASLIEGIPGYSLPISGTFFKEFVVQCPLPPAEVNDRLTNYRIIGGLDVSDMAPNGMLFCVTEMNGVGEIEALAEALAEIGASA